LNVVVQQVQADDRRPGVQTVHDKRTFPSSARDIQNAVIALHVQQVDRLHHQSPLGPFMVAQQVEKHERVTELVIPQVRQQASPRLDAEYAKDDIGTVVRRLNVVWRDAIEIGPVMQTGTINARSCDVQAHESLGIEMAGPVDPVDQEASSLRRKG
jgi:hypothetical protein